LRQAELGDKVEIHFIGTVDNGSIFESYDADSPLQITLGKNEIFRALEHEIIGMNIGEVKNILIKSDEAYGPRLKENIVVAHRSLFPSERTIEIGQKLSIQFADGENRVMLVVNIENDDITLDGNHTLAGLDLTFALKLVDILD